MGPRRRFSSTASLGALLALGLSACKTEQPKPPVEPAVPPPRVAVRTRYQLGGPLRGPLAPGALIKSEAMDPSRALALDVTFIALGSRPSWDLGPISSQARVVLAEGEGGGSLRSTPVALKSARVGLIEPPLGPLQDLLLAEAAARPSTVVDQKACLVLGTTTAIEIVRDDPPGKTGETRRERATVLFGRRADGAGLDVAIELETAKDLPELVVLATPIFGPTSPPASWVALIPSPFAGDEARLLALVANVSPGPVAPKPGAAQHEERVQGALRWLMAQSETAQLATAPLPPPPQVPDVEATRRALADPLLQRRSLYSLAAATGAKTAETLAISTDDHTLAPIASAISAALARAPHTAKAEEMGFVVEEATLGACRKSLTSDVPPQDLPAALDERGGAALRLLPSLIGELERVHSLAELESTIVALNARLLLDPSPTIRARAARWLGPRIPLEGYSPLAPTRERRAAVERIKARLAEAASPEAPKEHEGAGADHR